MNLVEPKLIRSEKEMKQRLTAVEAKLSALKPSPLP